MKTEYEIQIFNHDEDPEHKYPIAYVDVNSIKVGDEFISKVSKLIDKVLIKHRDYCYEEKKVLESSQDIKEMIANPFFKLVENNLNPD